MYVFCICKCTCTVIYIYMFVCIIFHVYFGMFRCIQSWPALLKYKRHVGTFKDEFSFPCILKKDLQIIRPKRLQFLCSNESGFLLAVRSKYILSLKLNIAPDNWWLWNTTFLLERLVGSGYNHLQVFFLQVATRCFLKIVPQVAKHKMVRLLVQGVSQPLVSTWMDCESYPLGQNMQISIYLFTDICISWTSGKDVDFGSNLLKDHQVKDIPLHVFVNVYPMSNYVRLCPPSQ